MIGTVILKPWQSEVDQSNDTFVWINENVAGFDITVNNIISMHMVDSFQQIAHVESNIAIAQGRVKGPMIGEVDVFDNHSRKAFYSFFDHIVQLDYVGSTT